MKKNELSRLKRNELSLIQLRHFKFSQLNQKRNLTRNQNLFQVFHLINHYLKSH